MSRKELDRFKRTALVTGRLDTRVEDQAAVGVLLGLDTGTVRLYDIADCQSRRIPTQRREGRQRYIVGLYKILLGTDIDLRNFPKILESAQCHIGMAHLPPQVGTQFAARLQNRINPLHVIHGICPAGILGQVVQTLVAVNKVDFARIEVIRQTVGCIEDELDAFRCIFPICKVLIAVTD